MKICLFKYLLPLMCFALAFQGTNAKVEIVISVMNALWTNETFWFIVETVGVLLIKTHFKKFLAPVFTI